MMHDEEAASLQSKSNPKNFGPNVKSIKLLGYKLGSVGFLETTKMCLRLITRNIRRPSANVLCGCPCDL